MAETNTQGYTIRYATEHDIPEILRMIQELASYEQALHEVLATEEKLFDTLSFPTSTNEKVKAKSGAARTLLITPKDGEPATTLASAQSSNVAQEAAGEVEVETSNNAEPAGEAEGQKQATGSTSASDVAQEAAAKLESETSSNAGPTAGSSGKGGKEQIAGMALFFNNYSTWLAKPGIYLEDLFVRPAFRKRGYGKALMQALARECVDKDYGRLEWSVLRWNKPSIDFYESETIGAVSSRETWEGMRCEGEALMKLARSSSS